MQNELEKKILAAKKAYYYSDKPLMSDDAFDALVRELKKKKPDSPVLKLVGAPVPGTKKVPHVSPMGSLNNAMNEEEFRKWFKTVAGRTLIAQHKYDGLSIELVYENGIFVQAITRGDGSEGEDVTDNIGKSSGVPFHIDAEGLTSVKAECVIHTDDFEKHFTDAANPRNAAAGTVRRQDGRLSEYLHVYAYATDECDTEWDAIEWLEKQKFLCGPSLVFETPERLMKWYTKQLDNRDKTIYEIDGIVVKVNDCEGAREMGESSDLIPRAHIAFKFPPKGGVTTLREVAVQVGHTGILTPVAKVKPVKVGGTTIKSITLCNWDEIERLGIQIGDKVEVIRAGDVIPKITCVIQEGKKRSPIEAPTACPVCGGSVKAKGAHHICTNQDCDAQAYQKIQHWVKERNIMFLGDGILESLYESGAVRKIEDLYLIEQRTLARAEVGNGNLGVIRAKKILAEIEKSKKVSLGDFFGSLGVPLLGKSLATRLVKQYKIESVDAFIDYAMRTKFEGMQDMGKQRSLSLQRYFRVKTDDVLSLASHMVFATPSKSGGNLNGKSFCFTGEASVPRAKLQAAVTGNGGIVKTSVTKDLDYLVMANPKSNSGKAKKAQSYGTQCISELDFFLMAEGK